MVPVEIGNSQLVIRMWRLASGKLMAERERERELGKMINTARFKAILWRDYVMSAALVVVVVVAATALKRVNHAFF